MSVGNEFPTLQDICLDDVATNIVKHGQQYAKYGEEDSSWYTALRSRFTDRLLKKIFQIFCEKDYRNNEELSHFIDFLFRHGDPKNVEAWPCLNLIFNRYTTFSPYEPGRTGCRESPDILTYMALHCENIMIINSERCWWMDDRFSSAGPIFQNLQTVSLQHSNDQVLERILYGSPLIESLSAYSGCHTEELLFSLCKYNSEQREFALCPENGECWKVGKQLRKLQVRLRGASADGIACALQHLPMLEVFGLNLLLKFSCLLRPFPDIMKGIAKLQTAAAVNGRPPAALQLTEINVTPDSTPTEASVAVSRCPKLSSIHLELPAVKTDVLEVLSSRSFNDLYFYDCFGVVTHSGEFEQFLSNIGEEVESLYLVFNSSSLLFSQIDIIFRMCQNIKKLVIDCSGKTNNVKLYLEGIVLPKIEEMKCKVGEPSGRCVQNILDLLILVQNVKILDLTGELAESALNEITFPELQIFRLRNADARRIPLRKLIRVSNKLKRIDFINCKRQNEVIEDCKEIAEGKSIKLQFVQLNYLI